MHTAQALTVLLSLPLTTTAIETVLGVYIFSRHGDRTSKSTPPTVLTDLGYSQVFSSGSYFNSRYIANGSSSQIHGISDSRVSQSQIAASAPQDTVLFPSALGFLQGLYPPLGSTSMLGKQTLRNGTTVEVPLDGYQLIPVATVGGAADENSAWLQGNGNCAKAIVSSNNYFASDEYKQLQDSTMDFYKSLEPMINSTFAADAMSYKNAYSIFDYLNVASIHNTTITSSTLLTPTTLSQLHRLADTHEFNLAYNASDPIRAIAGATLAAEILQALNKTVTSEGKTPLNVQFGAYGGFQSFFGLANLTDANANFFGVPDYASTMTFELVTNVAPSPFPKVEDLGVRFFFRNGSASNDSEPIAYPLFGQQNTTLSWNDFAAGINKFAVGSQAHWCEACGNSTGVCASGRANASSTSAKDGEGGGGSGGISKVVAGVIGAMVTMAVILGVEALIMLVAGLRLVSKKNMLAGVRDDAMAPKA